MERAEHGILGGARRTAVVDCVDQHREAERIAEQDELLTLVVTEMAGPGQEADGQIPFLLGSG